MHPLLFQFGHLGIPTYGTFVAFSLVTALAALVHFARKLELDSNRLWTLGLIGILTGLIAARLLVVAEYFSAFCAHPFWVLGLTAIRSEWVDPCAALIGVCAAMLYALAESLPLRRVLDGMVLAATPAFVIQQAGAFLAGTDFGLPNPGGWGVTYKSPIAARWYGTPLGVKLYPVQLYEAVTLIGIFAFLVWRLRHQGRDGELCGVWLLLAGVAGFFVEFYRAASGRGFWAHEALCLAMVVASAALLIRRRAAVHEHRYTGVNDPQRV